MRGLPGKGCTGSKRYLTIRPNRQRLEELEGGGGGDGKEGQLPRSVYVGVGVGWVGGEWLNEGGGGGGGGGGP